MMSFICGNYKLTLMNVYANQKQTHRDRKQTCGYQGVRGEGQIRVMDVTDTSYFS